MRLKFALIVFFVLLVTFVHEGYAEPMTFDTLNQSLERAKALEEKIELPQGKDTTAEQAARAAADKINSAEFQEQVAKHKKLIKSALPFVANENPNEREGGIKDKMLPSEKVMIFISSSIPINTLRTYVRDISSIEDPGITLIMRGFLDGMREIRPTMEFIQKILLKDEDCIAAQSEECETFTASVEIDPLKFRRFNITSVPAIVYAESMGKDDKINSRPDATIIYGDIPLRYALEKIRDETKR